MHMAAPYVVHLPKVGIEVIKLSFFNFQESLSLLESKIFLTFSIPSYLATI